MLPKYSKVEIKSLVQNKLSTINLNDINVNQQTTDELLDEDTFWQSKHYKTAATIIGTTPEELVKIIPGEPLDSISFRAEENTEKINHLVEEIDDIFEILAYQLKIGELS